MKKLLIAAFALVATSAQADDDYNLFNPTPDDKLRPFTTERPSKTDSIFTVDPGHIVVESSLDSYTHDDEDDVKSHENSFLNTTTFRLGLTESSEVQVLFNPYSDLDIKDKATGTESKLQGFGDTYVRYKYNITGDNNEAFGAAVIPFIKFPTSNDNLGNHDIEGGIEIPLNYNLPDNWTIGGETQYNVLKSQDSSGYYGGYVNTLVLGKSIGDWSGYTEFYTFLPDTGDRAWQNTLDFGVIYSVSDNFHIDTGINFGVSQAAPDVNYFVGFAFRF